MSMRKIVQFLLALMPLICPLLQVAAVPTTNLEGVLQLPDATPFNLTARITLNHDEYTTFSRNDGTFVIYNVKPGIHQLDIHNSNFHFPQIKIQLLEESMDTPKCLEYTYPGATKNSIAYPLVLSAIAAYDYFEPRKGFSIFTIFKNPMFLMMAFSVGMMYVMPKMMEGLDPEEKERMKQQMANQQDPTKMLSNLFSMGGEEEPAPKKIKKKN